MRRKILLYVLVLGLFGAGILAILKIGEPLSPSYQTLAATSTAGETQHAFLENLTHPFGRLLLQILIISIAALSGGYLFKKCGQPSVIGEITAGLLLGPSFLGWLFPDTMHFIFPPESLGHLHMLSQIGVLLFMFVVGMEFDNKVFRKEAHAAILISHASIIVPFFLGMLLSLYLFKSFSPPSIPFSRFSLFLGIAMSVTAFPVLARIIQEKGLTTTYLGTTALTCAAVDDVTAWSLLALIVAAGAGSTGVVLYTVTLTLLFVAAMIFLVRPFLKKILAGELEKEIPRNRVFALMLFFLLVSALYTELVGIHALFGAFLAGTVVPDRPAFKRSLEQRLENFSSLLLLPIFFALTGLRTEIGLLNRPESLVALFLIIAVAIMGKFGGSFVAARFSGMNTRDASVIGILMNTRGLMELVVLNMGYDMGILSAEMFTMMVMMALVTTFMTGPWLAWVGGVDRSERIK